MGREVGGRQRFTGDSRTTREGWDIMTSMTITSVLLHDTTDSLGYDFYNVSYSDRDGH